MRSKWTRSRAFAPIFPAALLAAAALVAPGAGAGTLGSNSNMSTNVSVAVQSVIQISSLDDVNLGIWTGSGRLQAFEFACVFTNAALYQVTASSANGTGNRTRLMDESGGFIRYVLHWRDSNGRQRRINHNQTRTNFFANATSADCGGSTNTRLRIRINVPWMEDAAPGAYSDTLTVVLAPQ
jgi:spore coat protein U-like protein